MRSFVFALALVAVFVVSVTAKLRERECEVCIKVVGDLQKIIKDEKITDIEKMERRMETACRKVTDKKEQRVCWYLGAMKDSATYMLRDVSQPTKNSIPAERICEKLKSKDAQICELMFDKKIDIATVDLSKLRVKELKGILTSWGESCDRCIDKDAYIRRINEVRAKHEPAAGAAKKAEL